MERPLKALNDYNEFICLFYICDAILLYRIKYVSKSWVISFFSFFYFNSCSLKTTFPHLWLQKYFNIRLSLSTEVIYFQNPLKNNIQHPYISDLKYGIFEIEKSNDAVVKLRLVKYGEFLVKKKNRPTRSLNKVTGVAGKNYMGAQI
mgnify:CR=1 FL=1